MVDTHCHLHFPQFKEDLEDILEKIKEKFSFVVDVGISLKDSLKALSLALKRENIFSTFGIHPHEAKDANLKEFETAFRKLYPEYRHKIVAIGEAGLDFYRNLSPKKAQIEVFEFQIELAKKYKLPLVIHCRQAEKDLIEILKEKGKDVKGIIHCFNGNKDLLKTALDLGYFISYSGIITYPKNENLRETVKYVPIDQILVETDSPYLPPQPVRGKRNSPLYVVYVIQTLADILQIDFLEFKRIVTVNAKRAFNLPLSLKELRFDPTVKVKNTLYIYLDNPSHEKEIKFFFGKNISKLPYKEELCTGHILYLIKNPKLYDKIVFVLENPNEHILKLVNECKEYLKKRNVQVEVEHGKNSEICRFFGQKII